MRDENMLMKFIDPSKNYAYGFECGVIWEKLENNESIEKYLCHVENKGQIEMMCRRFLYSFSFRDIDDTWTELTAILNIAINN